MSWLWDELRDLFEVDDGGLYDIRIEFAASRHLEEAFAVLLERGQLNPDATFWSLSEERDVPVRDVPNAATLVVSNEAQAFHVLFRGLRDDTVALPDLGVFVFDDQLAFDYRMGPEWGPEALQAFLHLLLELSSPDPGARLSLEEGVLPEVEERFQRCWRRYAEAGAA